MKQNTEDASSVFKMRERKTFFLFNIRGVEGFVSTM